MESAIASSKPLYTIELSTAISVGKPRISCSPSDLLARSILAMSFQSLLSLESRLSTMSIVPAAHILDIENLGEISRAIPDRGMVDWIGWFGRSPLHCRSHRALVP